MRQQPGANTPPRTNAAWLAYLTTTSARVTTLLALIRRCQGENNQPAADAARNLADQEVLAAVSAAEHAGQHVDASDPAQVELQTLADADLTRAQQAYQEAVAISALGRLELAAPSDEKTWHTPRLRLIAIVRAMRLLAERATAAQRSDGGATLALAYAEAVHIGNEMAEDEKQSIVRQVNRDRNRTPRPRGANRRLHQQARAVTIDQAIAVNAVKPIRRPHLDLAISFMLYEAEPDLEHIHALYHRFQHGHGDTLTHSATIKVLEPGETRKPPSSS